MTDTGLGHNSDFFFLPGSRGQLFSTLRRPAHSRPPSSALLCVMPLAEEMNRCRKLVANQATALAEQGIAVLCVDPFGTGDSEGELAEAHWQTWIDDLRLAWQWLATEAGCEAGVWTIRHGSLLAADAFRGSPLPRLLLWQPVVSGANAFSEMLRVSVASSMLAGSKEPKTVDALRELALRGETIEIGGYLINPDIAKALDSASLKPWPFSAQEADWIEVVAEASEGPQFVSQALLDVQQHADATIRAHTVDGRRFWSSPDVHVNKALSDLTLSLITDGRLHRD